MGWQERFDSSGEGKGNAPREPVWNCVLCGLPRRLTGPEIEKEAVLIWLPELGQAGLNVLVRGIHVIAARHGEPPHLDERPRTDDPALRAVFSAYAALRARAAGAITRLGTASPLDLGHALLDLPGGRYVERAVWRGGIRLLPLGRLFRDGRDIYPGLVDELANAPGGAAGAARNIGG
jgi:intracellular multiplication protein IcmJ